MSRLLEKVKRAVSSENSTPKCMEIVQRKSKESFSKPTLQSLKNSYYDSQLSPEELRRHFYNSNFQRLSRPNSNAGKRIHYEGEEGVIIDDLSIQYYVRLDKPERYTFLFKKEPHTILED